MGKKEKRPFMSFGRREFLEISAFGLVTLTGLAAKKYYFDSIPDFMHIEPEKVHHNNSLGGGFIWDNCYNLSFVHKYLDMARYLEHTFNLDCFRSLTSHPFPVEKYRLIKEKCLQDKILGTDDFSATTPLSIDTIASVHSLSYIMSLYFKGYTYTGLLNGENPVVPEMLNYIRTTSGGTLTACEHALHHGTGMNLNGGFHHAMPDHEEGFCYFNDTAIAVKSLRQQGLVKKVMVVDLDIHHGDGNARIMGPDPDTIIFDVYQQDNFPLKKYPVEYPIPLLAYGGKIIRDKEYMDALSTFPDALEKARPDIVIYLAGADPYKEDILGGFKMSKDGLRQRDEYVISAVRSRNIPLAVLLAGGYPKDVSDVVDIQSATVDILQSS